MSGKRRTWAAILVLVFLTGAAFLPVKNAGFVSYDDLDYVTQNPTVLKGLHPAGIGWALTTFDAGNWHPLTWVSHMLDVTLFGLKPGPHHLTNLALHATSAVLLLLLLAGMSGALWPSFLVAALFSIHPLHVESVAWISERKDVLSGLFAMLTLLAYLRYLKKPGIARYLAVVLAFVLGLMAKPMLVTLPFVLLLLDWWPLGRFSSAAGPRRPQAAVVGRLFVEKIPLLALTAISAFVTYIAQKQGGAMTDSDFFPLSARVSNAIVAYVRYLGKMFWPRDLIYFYPHPLGTLPVWQVAACLLVLALISAAAVALCRRRPWLATGWLWFLGMLVPVIGVVQVGRQAMADRYSYLPLIGLFVAIAWEARSRTQPSGPGTVARRVIVGAILVTLTILTYRQAGHWQNTQTLSNHLLSIDPRNYVAYNLKGMDLLLQHQPAAAVPLLRTSVALSPTFLDARYNLGLALAELGEIDEALIHFAAVVRATPRDAEALTNLGLQYVAKGDLPEALALFSRAAALEPRVARIQYHLGRTLDGMGRTTEAIAHYRTALALEPTYSEAHNNLGVSLAVLGRLDEAIRHFEEAVRLSPGYEEAGANLKRARRKHRHSP